MGNILTMNQTMFGNKFVERRASKRARKAQVAEFEFSTDIVEMTYDEYDEIDGGWALWKTWGVIAAAVCTGGVATGFAIACGVSTVGAGVSSIVSICCAND